MQQHEGKFEAATVAPIPVLQTGAMIRKGATGAQAEDGMTPEISAQIKEWTAKMVEHPEAIKWMYEGGPVPPVVDAPAPAPAAAASTHSTTTTVTHPDGTAVTVTTEAA